MDASTRQSLITGAAAEGVGIEHLEARIADGGTIRAYVGFEPSGKAHIGWKVLATNLRRMLDADVNVMIFMADWHAWVNDKFGGDMDKIQTTAKYMEEVFRSLLNHPDEGDGPGQLRFTYASDIMDSGEYWARVLRCSKNMSLARVRRTFSIMAGMRTVGTAIYRNSTTQPCRPLIFLRWTSTSPSVEWLSARHT